MRISDWSPDVCSSDLMFEFDLWGRAAYVYGLVLLAVVFILLQFLVRSPFGMLARGVREDPLRISAMGASVKSVLLRMYVISGVVAGIGGALNAISTQVVGLDSLSFTLSAAALAIGRPSCGERVCQFV